MSADQGNAVGQRYYGICLEYGRGIAKNLAESARYYKMSADQGDAVSQRYYGICLTKEIGVTRDLKEAARYYKMSADEGDAIGQHYYGMCLEAGIGVTKDLKEAARYYKMSADQGNEGANLGYGRCQMALADSLPSARLRDFDGLSEVEELGMGRFGPVWKVEDGKARKNYVVKYIRTGSGFDSAKLVREVEILSLLDHPCIVQLIGWSLPNAECGDARIGMEYVCNGSLESALVHVRDGRPPSFWTHTNVTLMIIGILLGMRYIHSKDIVHRNLKPSNILLDENYRIRICDFGSARLESCGTTTNLVSTLTYVAPETFEGSMPTKKVDVFAFGLILYEMLVGESVFPKGESPTRICELHNRQYRPMIPHSVSGPIADVIRKCWLHDANDRPDFEEIFATLEGFGFPFFNDVSNEAVQEFISMMNG
jgi:hypothetical protein